MRSTEANFCAIALIFVSSPRFSIFFAKKRNSPLRCIATFKDDKVDWDELVIKKVDVRTCFADPSQKYTRKRTRIGNDRRTGRTFAYTQAATTSQQQRTSTSRAAHQQAGRFAKASRRVYHATAARDNHIGGLNK